MGWGAITSPNRRLFRLLPEDEDIEDHDGEVEDREEEEREDEEVENDEREDEEDEDDQEQGFHNEWVLKTPMEPLKGAVKAVLVDDPEDDDLSPAVVAHPRWVPDSATSGPKCPECGEASRDNLALENHILTHYSEKLGKLLPAVAPFSCPECKKEHRDKNILLRHFAFGHGMIYQLTCLTHEQMMASQRGVGVAVWKPKVFQSIGITAAGMAGANNNHQDIKKKNVIKEVGSQQEETFEKRVTRQKESYVDLTNKNMVSMVDIDTSLKKNKKQTNHIKEKKKNATQGFYEPKRNGANKDMTSVKSDHLDSIKKKTLLMVDIVDCMKENKEGKKKSKDNKSYELEKDISHKKTTRGKENSVDSIKKMKTLKVDLVDFQKEDTKKAMREEAETGPIKGKSYKAYRQTLRRKTTVVFVDDSSLPEVTNLSGEIVSQAEKKKRQRKEQSKIINMTSQNTQLKPNKKQETLMVDVTDCLKSRNEEFESGKDQNRVTTKKTTNKQTNKQTKKKQAILMVDVMDCLKNREEELVSVREHQEPENKGVKGNYKTRT